MRGFKLILTPPVTSGGGAIARRPDGRQSEKHRIKGGGAIACGLLLTCVYGCRVHVISCVFLYPIMHPVRIQAKIVRSGARPTRTHMRAARACAAETCGEGAARRSQRQLDE